MIYFVGAGSGAPDLITVRGMRLLQKADVIIYAGSLVNPEILKYGRKEAEIYNSATMNLDEVLKVAFTRPIEPIEWNEADEKAAAPVPPVAPATPAAPTTH